MEYKTKEQLFEDFMKDEISYIDAIEVLQTQFGMDSKEAEALVEAWEN